MSDSNSDSSQSQLQESQDNRVVGGAGSVALVASRSSVGGDVNLTSTVTDFGTVAKAFDFAAGIAAGAADEAAASGARVTQVASSAMQSVRAAYQDTTNEVAKAYETAKAGEQKIMVAAALAVVAIVAVKVMGKST